MQLSQVRTILSPPLLAKGTLLAIKLHWVVVLVLGCPPRCLASLCVIDTCDNHEDNRIESRFNERRKGTEDVLEPMAPQYPRHFLIILNT
jgi:hypothetical protein